MSSDSGRAIWSLIREAELEQTVRAAEGTYSIFCDAAQLEQIALFHKALGDRTRLKAIGVLFFHDMCLCQLVEGLQVPTSTMNHHLQVLEKGGVIQGRREGKYTVYSLRSEHREHLRLLLEGQSL